MNSFIIVGTVIGEVKARRVQDKWDATEFTVEVKPTRKGGYPTKVRVEIFGFGATEAAEQVRAGMNVAAKGEAAASGFKGTKDPDKIYGSLEMKNATVEILSRMGSGESESPVEDRAQRPAVQAQTAAPSQSTDDLPF